MLAFWFGESDNATPSTERLLAALTPDVRMLIINSPGNPTGWTMGESDLRKVQQHCRARER